MSYKTSFKDGRLGIGLSTSVNSGAPRYPLDINGDIRLTGAILKSDGTTYTSGSGMGTPGIVSNQTDGVYKIGINNITPTVALDISGHGLITGDLQLNGTLKDSAGNPRIFSNWTIASNTTDLYRPNGNVGIGTTSPDAKLHVNATSTLGIYSMGDYTDYNYILNGPRPGESKGDGAVLYITSASYSGNDGEASTFTIRNDDGPTRLGKNNYKTTIEGDNIILNSNVGIGTTSPGYKLEVNGSAKLGDTTVSYLKSYLSSGTGIWFDYADTMRFITNNTEKMIIKSDGNVGIGTTSPDSKLHVNGNITLDACRTGSSYPTGSVGGGISFRAGAAYVPDSSNGAYNCSILTYAHDQSTDGLSINGYDGVSFCTGSSTRNEQMRIDSAGNVGIGTTSPGEKLHISGSGNVNLKIVSTNTSSPGIELIRTSLNNSTHHDSSIFADDAWTDWKIYNNGSKLQFQGGYRTATSGNHLSTSPQTLVTVMTMLNDGNVGIGTTTPDRTLHLYGSRTDIVFDGSGFEKHYIRKDGHYLRFRGNDDSTVLFELQNNSIGSNKCSFPSGNVGIGTTSPDAKLEIYKTVASGKTNTTPTNPSCLIYGDHGGEILWIGHPNQTQGLQLGYNTIKKWSTDNGATNDSLYFNISGATDMVIDENGNVGIGETAPSSKLYVNGDTRITGNLLMGGTATDGTPSKIHIGSYNSDIPTGTDDAKLLISGNHDFNGTLLKLGSYNNDSVTSKVVHWYSENGDNDYYWIPNTTGGIHYYKGNVGIGTEPGNFKIKVNGGTSYFERTCFGSDDINYSQVAIMSSPYKTNLLMGRASASSSYHGRWMYGGHHIDIYSSSTTQGEASQSSGTHQYLNYYSHYNNSSMFTACGAAFAVSYAGGDYGSAGAGRKNLFIGASYGRTGFNWGWWIGGQNENWHSGDGDLYFHVCRGSSTGHDAGYIQDGNSGVVMNFTGQHRTFVKDIPHKKTEPYVGLIVSANQNKYY